METKASYPMVPRTIEATAERIALRSKREANAILMFLGTLPEGGSLEEHMANLEADARVYGWSREAVRMAAGELRMRFSRKPECDQCHGGPTYVLDQGGERVRDFCPSCGASDCGVGE